MIIFSFNLPSNKQTQEKEVMAAAPGEEKGCNSLIQLGTTCFEPQKEDVTVNAKHSKTRIEYKGEQADLQKSQKASANPKIKEYADRVARVSAQYRPIHHNTNKKQHLSLTPAEIFGIEIGVLRRKRGLTITDLAERSEIEPDILFAIEHGVAPLKLIQANLRSIKEGLGVQSNHLDKKILDLVLA